MKLSAIVFGTLGSTRAFTVVPRAPPKLRATSFQLCMANVGVFFGTSTGNTEDVATMLVEKLGAEGPFDVDEGESVVESFQNYDALIVGTPTWNTGADRERSGTGWDELYYGKMEDLQLSGKKVAVFGLGDSVSYAENFSDAAGELHDVFQKLGCKMYGYVSQEGYLHEDSKSIRGDKFCGLLIDAVNQEDLTEERVNNWVEQLTEEGFLDGDSVTAAPKVAVASATPAMAKPNLGSPGVSPLTPDSFFFSSDPDPVSVMAEMVAKLERENAMLKKKLEGNSAMPVLEDSIVTHNSGYQPHINPVTGKTMWTSPDGRSCYFTDGVVVAAPQRINGMSL